MAQPACRCWCWQAILRPFAREVDGLSDLQIKLGKDIVDYPPPSCALARMLLSGLTLVLMKIHTSVSRIAGETTAE